MNKAFLISLLLILAAPGLQAGDGHNHGDEAPTANANGPRRLPDGSVFLPKPAQRQMGVRTLVSESKPLPRSAELSGRVVMDPHSGGKIQAMVAGRLEPGPQGMPSVGQAVRKGEVLAYVTPSASQIERSNQGALLAELKANQALAQKRLARLHELSDTVPRKEIEAAESEVQSLGARIAAVSGGLTNKDALVAPVSGVIASANGVAGQVVEARELLFEVVDPDSLHIEALAYDHDLVDNVARAQIVVGKEVFKLNLLGGGQRLKEQAIPLLFDNHDKGAGRRLALGQPVKVQVATREAVPGIAVPAAAVVRNPSNQSIVWVKSNPEQFVPRTVVVEPLDGLRVNVVSGLQAGERVVVLGANLLNQVR